MYYYLYEQFSIPFSLEFGIEQPAMFSIYSGLLQGKQSLFSFKMKNMNSSLVFVIISNDPVLPATLVCSCMHG